MQPRRPLGRGQPEHPSQSRRRLTERAMTLHSLEEIEAAVLRLARLIGASGTALPTFGHSDDGARPHVEVDARGYHFVVVERGQELERFTTGDLDALLCRVFESATFELACGYELAHRVEGRDFRRLLFQHQVELLARLSPGWAEREAADHARILQAHPFDDASEARVRLAVELQGGGHTPDAAWARASERYPLPQPEGS